MSRVRADNLTNRAANGAPLFTHGASSSGVITATTFDGNLTGNTTGNVTGNLTGDVTGNITGTAATFTGNVSIGGTLTYEDVTNVDSVGMVTARKGIQVLADGITVVGVSTFNDDIIGDNATNISGINSVTATTFYGNASGLTNIPSNGGGGPGGSGLSQVVAWNNSKTALNDGANGRLDVFGGGNFTVFYESGSFDTAGITSMRVRVVGAGSSGHNFSVCSCPNGFVCCTCCPGGSGSGGGYTHKVYSAPQVPGGTVNIKVGTPWSCCSPSPTVGDSCFGSSLIATGGVGRCGFGGGSGGDVNYSGGCGTALCSGGSAGSQLGNGCPDGRIAGTPTACYCTMRQRGVERFPFDIFTGHPGGNFCVQKYFACGGGLKICSTVQRPAGGSGGFGGVGQIISPNSCGNPAAIVGGVGGDAGTGAGGGTGTTGGAGGYGGGGGGSIYIRYPTTPTTCCNCQSSGAGGPGLVIIEW